MKKLFVVVLLVFAVCNAKKYKPVVLLHGILTGNDSMMNIRDRILEVTTKPSSFVFVDKHGVLFLETPGYCDLQYRSF